MPGLADIYSRMYDSPAKFQDTGAEAKALTGMIPHSGYAAPLVAMAAGQALSSGSEADAQTRQVESFLATFEKLSKVSPGEAVSFFNNTAPKVLKMDAKIDTVNNTPTMTSVHVSDTNDWMGIDKTGGGVKIFDTAKQTWRPLTAEDGARIAKSKQDKKSTADTLALSREQRLSLDSISSHLSQVASAGKMTLQDALIMSMGGDAAITAAAAKTGADPNALSAKNQVLQTEVKRYRKLFGEDPFDALGYKNATAPAPAAGTAGFGGFTPTAAPVTPGPAMNPAAFGTPGDQPAPAPAAENWRAYLK